MSKWYGLSLSELRSMRLAEFGAYRDFMVEQLEAEQAAIKGDAAGRADRPSTIETKGEPRRSLGKVRPPAEP